jgi:hypothetical protein
LRITLAKMPSGEELGTPAGIGKATVVPQSDDGTGGHGRLDSGGNFGYRGLEVTNPARFIVRDPNEKLTRVLIVILLTSVVAGCSGSDLLSKDAEWFSRPQRLFIRSVSIDTPPLTPDKPITADDLVSAEGGCPGMTPPGGPADANASSDAAGAAPVAGSSVALGHTECDVVRGIGAPDSVNINGAGDARVATVTWLHGARAGIYTFAGGRLTSVERAPDAGPQPKVAKPKGKKKHAAT